MTYIASIDFLAVNGKWARRQFLVTNPADILKAGMHVARAVGGTTVEVKGWTPLSQA
jgi:hypothetical protein